MGRIHNFSAGPAVLPLPVLEQARDDMVDYKGSGLSVMEMSHRSKEYLEIITNAEALLRELMGIPANYKVLFLQGGATLQFAMVPMNLVDDPENQTADYVITGAWSKKALEEARKVLKNTHVAASSAAEKFTRIPRQDEWQLSGPRPAFVHITTNNTIYGTEYSYTPDTGDIPLVADASSNILSRPVDVNRFGLIYAGAQKNLGPSGVTVVIVREDLVGLRPNANLPVMLDYKPHVENGSMLNTPPTYAIYILGLVLQWVKAQGGVNAIETRNLRKAEKLYGAIDGSNGFYACPVKVDSRSRMNAPFILANDALTETFLAEAKKAGLSQLKGHRSVGGMRASMYNALPEESVDALVEFMAGFAQRNG
ncbi:MAG: 3-phosphoserine/phosphohydroxythreonine transaminase [Magnetococcales bacterium]|nr:3-phosphoserine/phosphohydroxythreonine transaminase [Magnetococcales bacterium]